MNYKTPVPKEEKNISILNNRTVKEIITFKEEESRGKVYEVFLILEDGAIYRMNHQQDCCEDVYLDDVAGGELKDLEGQKILSAYQTINESSLREEDYDQSNTWTFYTINTMTHSLTLRWYGESNGYYSEDVDFGPATKEELEQLKKWHQKPYNH